MQPYIDPARIIHVHPFALSLSKGIVQDFDKLSLNGYSHYIESQVIGLCLKPVAA